MRASLNRICLCLTASCVCVITTVTASAEGLRQGSPVLVGGRSGVIKALDTLPYVENTYTRRMIWQKYDDPRLAELRRTLRLDDVLLKGKDEFSRQLHLMTFVRRLWKFGDPRVGRELSSAHEIIRLQRKEDRFYCEHYACVFSGLAASVGWVYRLVSHDGHTWGEMWSNQHRKWMYFDPTATRWIPGENGVPLTTAEVREKVFSGKGRIPARYGLSSSNRSWGGDRRFRVIGFHPNTNLMDMRFDYEKMFIIRDRHSGSKRSVRRRGEPVENPLVDPYFPINQAALALEPAARGIRVSIRTLTPNFKTFRARLDGGKWLNCRGQFVWKLHNGKNLLDVKSVNMFEVDGPVSRAVVDMRGGGAKVPDSYIGTPAPEEGNKVAGMPALKPAEPDKMEVRPEPFDESLKPRWISWWNTKGHWIEWVAEVPASGPYRVSLIYSTSYYPKRELRVNGSVAKGLETFTLADTGSWYKWRKGTLPVPVRLKAGKNILRLTCKNEVGVWIKQIRLSRTGRRKEIVLEAFDFKDQGGITARQKPAMRTYDLLPRNAAENRFIFFSYKGQWLEWNVRAPSAGEYKAYISVGALVDAERNMTVNGVVIKPHNGFKIPRTGGWRVWSEVLLGTARLKAGSNLVRLTNLSEHSGPNLHQIRFVGKTGKEIVVNSQSFTAKGGGTVTLMPQNVKK